MRAIDKYPILTLTTILLVNISLAFFLILTLTDGILEYKIGLVASLPIILLILFTLARTFSKYFSRQNIVLRNTLKTIVLIVLGLIILLILIFNIIVWSDLLDGKTEYLLP
jgi:hypothetical protein